MNLHYVSKLFEYLALCVSGIIYMVRIFNLEKLKITILNFNFILPIFREHKQLLVSCCSSSPQGDSVQAGDESPFSDSVTLEQTTSTIGGSSGRVSLWMQWMLPKVTIKLFAPDLENKGTGTGVLFLPTVKIKNYCF